MSISIFWGELVEEKFVFRGGLVYGSHASVSAKRDFASSQYSGLIS